MSGQDTQWSSGGQWRLHTGQAIGVLGGAVQAGDGDAGVQLIAAQGAIDVQAQSDTVRLQAREEVNLISANAHIDWAAAKSIRLSTAGGANITIEGGNITIQCPGKITNMSNIANESLKAVKAATDAAVTYFQQLYGYSVRTYREARRQVLLTARVVVAAHKIVGQKALDAAKETSRMIVDGATRAGHNIHDAEVEAQEKLDHAAKTAKNAMEQASQEARIYYRAEKKIIVKYIKAEAEWKAQQIKRWLEEDKSKDF